MVLKIMYVVTLFELNLPQSESGSARYAAQPQRTAPSQSFGEDAPASIRFVNFEMLFIFKIRFCLEKRYVFIIRLIPLLCHTNVTDFQGYIR